VARALQVLPEGLPGLLLPALPPQSRTAAAAALLLLLLQRRWLLPGLQCPRGRRARGLMGQVLQGLRLGGWGRCWWMPHLLGLGLGLRACHRA
jgi:hypothetical protein